MIGDGSFSRVSPVFFKVRCTHYCIYLDYYYYECRRSHYFPRADMSRLNGKHCNFSLREWLQFLQSQYSIRLRCSFLKGQTKVLRLSLSYWLLPHSRLGQMPNALGKNGRVPACEWLVCTMIWMITDSSCSINSPRWTYQTIHWRICCEGVS